MKQRMGKMLFFLFSAGMAAGILIAFFLRGYLLDEFDIMQAGLLQSLDEKMYSRVGMFFFLLWQRGKQALFFLFLLMTAIGLPFLYVTAAAVGAVSGCYLFAACCRYGISGTVVFLMAFFPQGCIYLLLCYLLMRLGLKGKMPLGSYDGGKNEKKRGYQGKLFGRGVSTKGIFQLFLSILLLILGCFVETCFHPPLFRWILHLAV